MENFSHPFFEDVLFYKHLISTSQKAEQLIRNRETQGNLLVCAETQTGGMGRNNRTWFSPQGGLWFSCGIFGLSVAPNLTIFTGIVLHQTLTNLFPEIASRLTIKWPNDIYLDNKKIAGILCSNLPRHRYHIIGIGINTNVENFSEDLNTTSTSLKKALNRDLNNENILKNFFDNYALKLPNIVEGKLDTEYFNNHSLLNDREILLDTDFDQYRGKVIGINKNGAILLELKPGMIQPFLAGSIVEF